jgi:thiamine pyrophosphate-dependent acetolactate synthase large subunit-like protein
MTKGSDLLVAALEKEGVDRIFALPGEENLDVLESLRNSKIELVLTRHEQRRRRGDLPAVPGFACRRWVRAR